MSSTHTYHRLWGRSSAERRFFDTPPSHQRQDSWSSLEPSRYPNATRTRMFFAHALGVAGILGTLVLALYALSSRAPTIASRAERVLSDVRLPWIPVLNAGPAPLALDWQRTVALPGVTTVTSETTPTVSPAPTPSPDASSSTASVTPTEPAPSVPAPSVTALEAPPPVPAPSVIPTVTATATVKSPAPASAPAPQRAEPPARVVTPVAPFTPEEIQRRKERYEQWLREQQLERVE